MLIDWPHLHLALNHLPVLGIPFALFLLLWSLWRGHEEVKRLSVWIILGVALLGIGVKYTGDFAAEEVLRKPGFEASWVEKHEQAADQATTGLFFLVLMAGMIVFLNRGGRQTPKWALALLITLSLITCVFLMRTANRGGQIRHPEIRGTPQLTLRSLVMRPVWTHSAT